MKSPITRECLGYFDRNMKVCSWHFCEHKYSVLFTTMDPIADLRGGFKNTAHITLRQSLSRDLNKREKESSHNLVAFRAARPASKAFCPLSPFPLYPILPLIGAQTEATVKKFPRIDSISCTLEVRKSTENRILLICVSVRQYF